MKKAVAILVPVLLLVGLFPLSVMADETLVQFEGGIGVIPVSSAAGTDPTSTTVNRNIVRGVQPPGQIWVIADLRADVEVDGRIQVGGRGLLLGGGNGIGTNGGQSVRAVLFCDTARHDSGLVLLEANGDFRIDDVLTPTPPDPCASPVLLIVNAGDRWFAAGIPRQ